MSGTDAGRPITVGVADKQHAALAFAADEARLSGCDLRVVHAYVVPPTPPQVMGVSYGFDIDGSFRDSGQEVLADATSFLASDYGDLAVHQVLEQGAAPMVLMHASATSRLLVLGPDDATPWYSRLFLSRVSRKLAHEASCPVVVVPDTWSADVAPQAVTLMLDHQTVAHGPLRYAFEHASRHHVALHIVHVHTNDGSEEEAIPFQDMQALIGSWRAMYRRVWADTQVVSGVADSAMVQTFEHTGLVVLGRPHAHQPLTPVHRSLARAVIERAGCPVAVVPAHYDD